MLVSGEAGIGKSVLARRFCDARRGQVRVFWGACDALQTPRPLSPRGSGVAAADRRDHAGGPVVVDLAFNLAGLREAVDERRCRDSTRSVDRAPGHTHITQPVAEALPEATRASVVDDDEPSASVPTPPLRRPSRRRGYRAGRVSTQHDAAKRHAGGESPLAGAVKRWDSGDV